MLSLIESSRPPKAMDYRMQLTDRAKCDAEPDLVKQAVERHEHEVKGKKEEGDQEVNLCTSLAGV